MNKLNKQNKKQTNKKTKNKKQKTTKQQNKTKQNKHKHKSMYVCPCYFVIIFFKYNGWFFFQ